MPTVLCRVACALVTPGYAAPTTPMALLRPSLVSRLIELLRKEVNTHVYILFNWKGFSYTNINCQSFWVVAYDAPLVDVELHVYAIRMNAKWKCLLNYATLFTENVVLID